MYIGNEVTAKIEDALRMYHATRNPFAGKQKISKKMKMNAYKTIFMLIMSFDIESWSLTNRMRSWIQY